MRAAEAAARRYHPRLGGACCLGSRCRSSVRKTGRAGDEQEGFTFADPTEAKLSHN